MTVEQEIQAIADVLDAFPMQRGAPDGFEVGVPPESRLPWAARLHKRGVRVHPDLAEEVSIPGNQPGMGRFNPRKWVPKDQVPEPETTAPDDSMREAAAALLEMTNPAMAEKIRKLRPDEQAEFMRELEAQVPDALANLKQVRNQVEPEKPPRKTAKKRAPKKPS